MYNLRVPRVLQNLQISENPLSSGSDSFSLHLQTFSRAHRRNLSDFSQTSDRRNSPDGLQVCFHSKTTELEVRALAQTVLPTASPSLSANPQA